MLFGRFGTFSRFYLAPESGGGDGPLSDDDVLGGNEDGGSDENLDDTVDATHESDDADSDSGAVGSTDGDTGEIETDDTLASRAAADKGGKASTMPSLAEVYKHYGLSGLPDDPNELAARFQRASQAEQQAEQMRNALLWQLHNQQQQQAQQQQWAAQQSHQQQKPVFDLPEYHNEWLNGVVQDEQGNLVAKPGWPVDLPQKIQQFAKAREQANLNFLKDPLGVLEPHLIPRLQNIVEQQVQQRLSDFQRRQALSSYEKENASWVFANGKGGAITPAAQMFNQHYNQAIQMGHPDPLGYADQLVRGAAVEEAYYEQQQKLAAQQAAAEKKAASKQADKEFIKKAATRQTSRGGAQANGTTKRPQPRADGAFPRKQLLEALKGLPDDDFAFDGK